MGRSACCSKVGLRRGPWSAKEDSLLSSFIQQYGDGQWRSLPNKAGLLRCGKSCRLRWMNYLRPGIKRGNISQDEEDLIVRLHALLGNRWSLIAGRLQGRTDNEIKNYWNTHLLKKLANAKPPPPAAAAKKFKKPPADAHNKKSTAGQMQMQKSKVYLPKPIRVSPALPRSSTQTQSYDDSLLTGSSSSDAEAEAEIPVSAWPSMPMFEVDDMPAALYHYSDSVSDEVNIWEKVYAEYMQLL